MRVILDTNIFISGVFFDGEPRKVLDLIESKIITPCFLPQTFDELKHFLSDEKFLQQRALLPFLIEDFLNRMEEFSLFFHSPSKIPNIIKEDSADNYFLACALAARADFIVSGDRHLLLLKSFQGIPILTPKQFLKRLK